jgi:hypothetical protein
MASVRAATAEDAVTCAEIVTDLPDYFTDDVPDKVRSDLRGHGGWVVDDGRDVVGFVIAERRGTRARGDVCNPAAILAVALAPTR